MPFQPGQSGNPKGRPKKGRTLTASLLSEFARSQANQFSDKNMAARRILARLVSSAVLNGKVTLPDRGTIPLNGREWIDLVKWVYTHLDGPATLHHTLDVGEGVRIIFDLPVPAAEPEEEPEEDG